jgi:hypothetical protein
MSALVSTARDLARMKEGRVAISEAALRQVRDLFGVDSMDASSQSPVPASFVRDVREATDSFGRFVGRRDELRIIGEGLASATKHRARILTVVGDPGIGKTRLLFEVARRLRKGSYDVGWHIAKCPPRGREFAFSGIVSMLQVLCGVVDGDSSERIFAVEPRLRALGLHDDEVSVVLAALGAKGFDPQGNAKSALVIAFARIVASLCEDRPYAFAWDDANAMDGESLTILEETFKRVPNVRVLFVLVTPSRNSPLTPRSTCRTSESKIRSGSSRTDLGSRRRPKSCSASCANARVDTRSSSKRSSRVCSSRGP